MTLYGKYYIDNIESIRDMKNRLAGDIQLKLALCLLKTEVMENTLPSTTGSADCVHTEEVFPDDRLCLLLQVLGRPRRRWIESVAGTLWTYDMPLHQAARLAIDRQLVLPATPPDTSRQ